MACALLFRDCTSLSQKPVQLTCLYNIERSYSRCKDLLFCNLCPRSPVLYARVLQQSLHQSNFKYPINLYSTLFILKTEVSLFYFSFNNSDGDPDKNYPLNFNG